MPAKPQFNNGYWRLRAMIKGHRWSENFGHHPGWKPGDPEPKCPREVQVKADKLLVEWRRQSESGSGGPPTTQKLAALLDEYEGTFAATHPPNSVRNLRTAITHLLNHFGPDVKAASLSLAHCQGYIDARSRAGAAYNTLRTEWGLLSPIWNRAVRLGLLRSNPWKEIRVPGKAEVKPPDFWSKDELARLVEGCHLQWVKDVVVVAANCGARITSLLTLRWGAVDFERGVIRLDSKTGTYETPLLKDARAVLERRKGARDELVFPGRDGKPMRRQAAYRAIQKVVEKVGLPEKGDYSHILRHSFASHCVMQGIPLAIVSKWLGHANIAVTMRYSHLCPAESQRYANMVRITT